MQLREGFLVMVDNKKKVVSGVVAATALTGAFVAPATAQAADNDAPNSIQETIQEATEAQKAAKAAPGKVNAAKKSYESVKKKANGEINKAKHLKNKAQKELDRAEKSAKSAKGTWERNVVEASEKAAKAEQSGKQGQMKQAKIWKQRAEDSRQNYEEAQTKVDNKQNILEQKKDNLLKVQTEQNAKVKAAQTVYQEAQAEQQKAIQMASSTKKAANGAWGNWDTKHTIEDRLTDDSGFQALIPEFQKLVQKERLAIGAEEVKAQRLDASKLFLKHDHEMRVWFINEGAGYRNQLAYEATKGDDYHKGMIFDDVSCTTGCQLSNGKNAPLDIGDFVDLGLIEGGTQLNFLLKADGANGSKTRNGDVYGADESLNRDGLQHLMAFEVNAGGREYLMMGFEDLRNGGDLDYNDAVFVVDFGEGNLTNTPARFAQAAKVPEASNMAAIFGVTGAALMFRRRRKKK
ncbi:MAG: DUF4114 domain-containing protein [Cyanobacteria bacterium J06621_15]